MSRLNSPGTTGAFSLHPACQCSCPNRNNHCRIYCTCHCVELLRLLVDSAVSQRITAQFAHLRAANIRFVYYSPAVVSGQCVSVLVHDQTSRVLCDQTQAVNMSNKAKTGGEDDEKQSPTDLQEIQLQMNATTDEVRHQCSLDRSPLIIILQFINDMTRSERGCETDSENRSAERIDVCIKPSLVTLVRE